MIQQEGPLQKSRRCLAAWHIKRLHRLLVQSAAQLLRKAGQKLSGTGGRYAAVGQWMIVGHNEYEVCRQSAPVRGYAPERLQ